jgi:hypothetical protein
MFAGNAGAYPSEAPFKCFYLGEVPGITQNIRLDWKELKEAKTPAY